MNRTRETHLSRERRPRPSTVLAVIAIVGALVVATLLGIFVGSGGFEH